MAEIFKFKTQDQSNMEEFVKSIQDAVDAVDAGYINNALLVAKNKDNEVIIGECNMNPALEMELIGHLQIHVINKINMTE